MKARTLSLIAALTAAVITSASAQTNLSISVGPGFNLITLPLQSPDPTSSINSVLTNTTPVMPFGSYVLEWDPVRQTYMPAVYAGGDGNWYDGTISFMQTNSLPPGTAFFLYVPPVSEGGVSNLTITVTGSVLTGTNSIYEYQAYGFYGNFEPVVGDITTNGFPITGTGSFLYTWNPALQMYNQAVFGFHSGFIQEPNAFYNASYTEVVIVAPPVGSGFIYYNYGPAAYWTQVFPAE